MFPVAPLALTVTLLGWGGVPAVPAESAAADVQPAAQEPAPTPPAPAPVRYPAGFDNYRTPSPPPVMFVAYPPITEVRWYGWELLLSDLGSLVVMGKIGGPLGIGIGAAGLVLGAPALHLANHNYGGAAASLAVRGGVALVIAGLASSQPPPCPQNDLGCSADNVGGALIGVGIAAGILLGGMVYAIVDDTVLARVAVERPRTGGFTPYVAPHAGGASFGLGGNF